VGDGWQLLKIRGIPLRIHPSWFFILALATLAFQQEYFSTDSLQATAAPLLPSINRHAARRRCQTVRISG
jgi:hypothetical protein